MRTAEDTVAAANEIIGRLKINDDSYQRQIVHLKSMCDSLKNDLQAEREKNKSEVLADYADDLRQMQYKKRDLQTSVDTWATR